MTRRIATVLIIALAVTLLGLGGCASAPKQTALMDEMGVKDVSARELRLRVYDFGISFSAEVERAADFIIAAAADPDIERRALMWKVNATTVMNLAIFQIDPLAAVIDATTFSYQMRAFFEDGAGFGIAELIEGEAGHFFGRAGVAFGFALERAGAVV